MLMELGRNAEAAERLEQRLLGVAPYDGRAALLLARIRFDQDPVANSRTARQLATRALRFGAGADAEDFIGRIDRATRAEAAPD
jgi:hypothetical protein